MWDVWWSPTRLSLCGGAPSQTELWGRETVSASLALCVWLTMRGEPQNASVTPSVSGVFATVKITYIR